MNLYRRLLPILAAVAAAPVLAHALAQAPQRQRGEEPVEVHRVTPGGVTPEGATPEGAMPEAQAEIIELFGRVELRLREIDELLSDASAGDTAALANVGPSGIDQLLQRSQQSGRQAVVEIDRILELAEQMNQQCKSSGSSGSCTKPGGTGKPSPLDQAGAQQTEREQTPDAPPQTAGQKPEPREPQPSRSDREPKSPLASEDPDPRNDPGSNPPGSDRELAAGGPDDLDRWGDLPIHARDVFRTQGGGEMPARYRDWIDSYYRRLNERR